MFESKSLPIIYAIGILIIYCSAPTLRQCSGSMTFWGGSESGSADPCFWLMDLDPAIFVIDLQDASKKLIYNTIFSAYYFLKVHLHHFSKIKSQKESQNRWNQGFSYYFCIMIEGSGSGSISLTSGSGSERPKNMWIRWIRIRNTPALRISSCWLDQVPEPAFAYQFKVYIYEKPT